MLVLTHMMKEVLQDGFASLKEIFYVLERSMMTQLPLLFRHFKVTLKAAKCGPSILRLSLDHNPNDYQSPEGRPGLP